jgi:PAS domain S-box-containing protein
MEKLHQMTVLKNGLLVNVPNSIQEIINFRPEFWKSFDSLLVGIQIIDFNWRYIYVNDVLARHGKIPKKKLLGQTMMKIYPGLELTEVFKVLHHCMSERKPEHLKSEFIFPDKSKRWFEINVEPVNEGTLIQSLDITSNREADEKIIKAKRLYAFISQINQKIVRVADEKVLFQNACQIACEFGKFKIAWIGMFDNARKKITVVDQCGIPAEEIKQFIDVRLEANGPQKYVLRTGEYYMSNDIELDSELGSWKPLATQQGISSFMILPIKKAGNIIGTFNLYAPELNFFDTKEIALLTEAAGDISFAIEMFEKARKQKRTEELVIKNEKRFRALIEKSADMKTLSTYDGEIMYCSPSITKILGYSPEEFFEIPPYGIVHPDDIPAILKNTKKILQTPGKSFYCRQQLLHKNGNWIWCEGTVTNLLHEAGVNALVSNFRNISERKTAELHEEFDRNNLKALINNTNDLMWSVDRDFKLITSNQPFDEMVRQMSGNTVAKGSNILSVGFSSEQLDRYKKFYERAFAGETFTEIEHTVSPIENWLEISYYPIRKGDKVIGTACHSRNITERKLAEFERIKITNDLSQRNKDLEQFAYIISHNLRAPVANIIGINDAMQTKELDKLEEKQMTEALVTSVKKIDDVITDLTHILQVRREVSEKKEMVKFSELLIEVRKSITELFPTEKVRFIINFSEVNEMLTLKSYLRSIFFNLISNSIKYRQVHITSVIKITSVKAKNKIELIFEDNGLGFDLKKEGQKIFGLYKRFHFHIEGKGMGLFMVKTQVESLGGKISIHSEVNKGTEFRIEFEKYDEFENLP